MKNKKKKRLETSKKILIFTSICFAIVIAFVVAIFAFSLVLNISKRDVEFVEKSINEKLEQIKGFVSLKVTSNGNNTIAVILYGDEDEAVVSNARVKIVEFPITNIEEAQNMIDKALETLVITSVEPICTIDMNRVVIIYDADKSAQNDSEGG